MASSVDIYHEGENIYVNLSLYNNQDAQINASIDVALEKPIVERANEYKLSIIRFTCPLGTVPRYSLASINFQVQIISSGGNQQIYGIGSASLPLNPIDSIAVFINLLNSAFNTAYTNFYNMAISLGVQFPANVPPYFMYDPRNRLISFVVPQIFVKPPSPITSVGVYVSNDIYELIYSFPTLPSNVSGFTRLMIQTLDNNIYTSPQYPSTNQSAYINYQEFPTDFEFNDLQSIIIATSLPVRNEFIPLSTNQPLQTVNPSIGTSGLSYISSIPVLTDYVVPVEQFGQQNQRIFYFPTAEFRWTDLIYSLAIDRLSFKFYYQTTDQLIHPLLLAPGDYVSVKILLRRLKQ